MTPHPKKDNGETDAMKKKRSERRKHSALAVVGGAKKFRPAAVPHRRTESAMAVVRQRQKIPPPQTPFPGPQDCQSLISWRWSLQTKFGEDRYTQFRVIVVTDTARPPPTTNTHTTPARPKHTHKHTDSADYNILQR